MNQLLPGPLGPASHTTADLERLLLGYRKRLLAYAARQIRKSCPGSVEPEDIVQAVYLKAIRRKTRFEPGDSDAALRWLTTIVRRQVADVAKAGAAAKRGGRRAAPASTRFASDEALASMLARHAADGPTPEQSAIAREDAAALESAISRQRPDYQRVIRLHFFDGKTIEETAVILGQTKRAVEARCSRALKALRDDLGSMPGFA